MSTSDFERIDALVKICEEHQKNLHKSLEIVTHRVKEVSESMSLRIHQITQRMSTLRSKFDAVHTNNQKLLDKIKEKLDEIDAQEMEAAREFDEFRRKVNFAKRQRRKHGLIRRLGYKLYNSFLTFVGWYKPVKKEEKKEGKKGEIVPIVSPSQHTLTLVRPGSAKLAALTPNVNPPDLVKKQQ